MRAIERLDYRIRRPIELRTRPATCEEVDCPAWRGGWVTTLDERDLTHRGYAAWVRQSGMDFVVHVGEDGLTRFTFAPGQPCFRRVDHRIEDRRIEHDPRFLRRSTWNGTRELSADNWVDDQATELDRLRVLIERVG